ncbi:unnamed protein product [Rotaria sp. Silwood2]|nr:unnamed protein product [Rotaria sp. Silwood2]CAF4347636.1 unnamed protein product [Rotaria sp. Silwood2]
MCTKITTKRDRNSSFDHEAVQEHDDDLDSTMPPGIDELQRYLALQIDKTSLRQNPLDFWRENQLSFPRLSKLARRIHSIPATIATVERQFSGAGVVINERRTNLKPSQVDNILFIRSCEKMSIF